MKTIFALLLAVLMSFSALQPETSADDMFVTVTTGDAETQMMAMVLATQSVNQGVTVRILLCSDGGDLALKDSESPSFLPPDRSPKQLLAGLLQRGVRIDVCGIYLPNRSVDESDLMEGVGVAAPPEVAEYMRGENVRFFTY
jgi:predicted peroxiredoxin